EEALGSAHTRSLDRPAPTAVGEHEGVAHADQPLDRRDFGDHLTRTLEGGSGLVEPGHHDLGELVVTAAHAGVHETRNGAFAGAIEQADAAPAPVLVRPSRLWRRPVRFHTPAHEVRGG